MMTVFLALDLAQVVVAQTGFFRKGGGGQPLLLAVLDYIPPYPIVKSARIKIGLSHTIITEKIIPGSR